MRMWIKNLKIKAHWKFMLLVIGSSILFLYLIKSSSERHYSLKTNSKVDIKYPSKASTIKFAQKSATWELNDVQSKMIDDLTFKEIGPKNIGGRTRSVLIWPGDPTESTWLLSNVSGGIWKTIDAGNSWKNVSRDLPIQNFSVLACSEAKPESIYVGTGEYYRRGRIYGRGIYKSDDGGDFWYLLESTNNDTFSIITDVIVDPNNANRLLASALNPDLLLVEDDTGSNIMISEDGGHTWRSTFNNEHAITQLLADPFNFDRLFAAIENVGYAKSVDGGESWELKTPFNSPERIALDISKSDSQFLVASVGISFDNSGHLVNVYFTENGGENWNITSDENGNTLHSHGQAQYNNCIRIHPFDNYTIYRGGVNTNLEKIDPEFVITVANKYAGYINNTTFLEFILEPSLPNEDFTYNGNIQIAFGAGKQQKAHRFSVGMKESGVADQDYIYEGYSDVPFEVWDVTNNRQMMISYRDQNENGFFDLEETPQSSEDPVPREYIFIHNIDYSENPEVNLSKNGGHVNNQIFFLWPSLIPGEIWEPNMYENENVFFQFNSQNATLLANEAIADPNVVHFDHHNYEFLNIDENTQQFQILDCNDGGLFLSSQTSTPINTWQFVGNGVKSVQFYSVDKRPGVPIYIGGTQDNGILVSTDETEIFNQLATGDGTHVIWHATNDQLAFGIINNISKIIITDSGVVHRFPEEIKPGQSLSIRDVGYSLKVPDDIILASQSGIYVSHNFGESFEVLDPNSSPFIVERSDFDSNIIWQADLESILVSKDNGTTFHAVSNYEGSHPLDIIAHPFESESAFILLQQPGISKIRFTEDLGSTWIDLTQYDNGMSQNGFPEVTPLCLYVFEDDLNRIWVGTTFGIVESSDFGKSWHLIENFPKVIVTDIKLRDGIIVIGTYGRGIWTAESESELSYQQQLDEITIYPMPISDGHCFVNLPTHKIKAIELIGLNGQAQNLISFLDSNGATRINLQAPDQGVYIMKIKLKNGREISKRCSFF